MSRTASVETVNRGERSCVHPTRKMIDPYFSIIEADKFLQGIPVAPLCPPDQYQFCHNHRRD